MLDIQPLPDVVAPGRVRRSGDVLAVTWLALAVVVSAMTSLNAALPDIALQTHADQTQQSWITDACRPSAAPSWSRPRTPAQQPIREDP